MTATIPRVPRLRGETTPAQRRAIASAADRADKANAAYRQVVLGALAEGASFAEVSKASGLSTNTLQRWKREAGQ